jgi:putative ABC transport system substrate-binding protein
MFPHSRNGCASLVGLKVGPSLSNIAGRKGATTALGEIAAELARLKVDVIVTSGGAGVAARQATSTIPIVLALANDPVGSGLAASMARPGGNVTCRCWLPILPASALKSCVGFCPTFAD